MGRIYLTLLSTTCVKIQKILYIILETISHSSQHNSFLDQTLHTFYKSSTSKCKFSDFPLLVLKFTKFFMSFLESRVSFSSNFTSFFSVIRYNSSVLFHLNLYMLWTKEALQSANFQTFEWSHEN